MCQALGVHLGLGDLLVGNSSAFLEPHREANMSQIVIVVNKQLQIMRKVRKGRHWYYRGVNQGCPS